MYTSFSPSSDAQDLADEMRRLEEVLLRAARAEQAARRRAHTARLGLLAGGLLGVVLFVVDAGILIWSSAWPRLVAAAVLMMAVYALWDAWARFRGAQAQLAEARVVLTELNARLRVLRSHRA